MNGVNPTIFLQEVLEVSVLGLEHQRPVAPLLQVLQEGTTLQTSQRSIASLVSQHAHFTLPTDRNAAKNFHNNKRVWSRESSMVGLTYSALSMHAMQWVLQAIHHALHN